MTAPFCLEYPECRTRLSVVGILPYKSNLCGFIINPPTRNLGLIPLLLIECVLFAGLMKVAYHYTYYALEVAEYAEMRYTLTGKYRSIFDAASCCIIGFVTYQVLLPLPNCLLFNVIASVFKPLQDFYFDVLFPSRTDKDKVCYGIVTAVIFLLIFSYLGLNFPHIFWISAHFEAVGQVQKEGQTYFESMYDSIQLFKVNFPKYKFGKL